MLCYKKGQDSVSHFYFALCNFFSSLQDTLTETTKLNSQRTDSPSIMRQYFLSNMSFKVLVIQPNQCSNRNTDYSSNTSNIERLSGYFHAFPVTERNIISRTS